MKTAIAAIAVSLAVSLDTVTATTAAVIYDGLSTSHQTLIQQGCFYIATSRPPAPSVQTTSYGTVLDTTGNSSNYAGFFIKPPFKLNRRQGYTISFTGQINSESHRKSHRAGFSIIAISNLELGETQPYGLELGFWQNSIWVQNVGFTRGEQVAFNTQAVAHTYKLSIVGTQYKLFADQSSTPILKGSLRQYTGFKPPLGYQNPYETPNLIFMGDDTTSAEAKVTIVRVEASSRG